mgnify:CR=1 FL=1
MVVGLKAAEGETVTLRTPVAAEGPVETWMGHVEVEVGGGA